MPELRGASRTTSSRWFIAAGVCASVTLLVLLVHILVPADVLQLAAIWMVGGSLLLVWAGILTWRVPVLGNRALLAIAAVWALGTALSTWLAGWALATRSFVWRWSAHWLALTLAFVVGALLLRALLRKRTAPVIGRLLSLASPLIILVVILVTSLLRAP